MRVPKRWGILFLVLLGGVVPARGMESPKTTFFKEACGNVLRFFPITRSITERLTRTSETPRFQTLSRIVTPPEIDLVEMRKLYLRDSAAMLTRLKWKYKITVLLADTHMTHQEAMNAPLISNWPSFWQYFHTPFIERQKIADAQKFYQPIFEGNPWLGVYFAPHSPLPTPQGMAFVDRPFVDQHVILIPQHASRIVILHEFMHSRIASHRAKVTGDRTPHRIKLLIEALEASWHQSERAMIAVVRDYFDEELALDEWMLFNRSALNFSDEETQQLLTRYWYHPKQIRDGSMGGFSNDKLAREYEQSLIRFVKKDPGLLEMSLRLGFMRAKERKE